MSDAELRQRLKAAGIDAGPITDDTRPLYVKALQKRGSQRRAGNSVRSTAGEVRKLKRLQSPSNKQRVLPRPVKRRQSSQSDTETPVTPKKVKYSGLVGQATFTGSSTNNNNNSAGVTVISDSDSGSLDQDDECFIGEASPSPSREPTGTKMLTTLAGSLHSIGSGVKEFVKNPIMKAAALLSPLSPAPAASVRPQQQREVQFERPSVSQPSPNVSPQRSRLSSCDWELQPSDVQLCRRSDGTSWCLGRGGFGEVFKGVKDGVDEVAVKRIKIASPHVVEQFKQEIGTIAMLRHRNILQFYGACIQPSCLYMVTELMQTDLFSALRREPKYFWTGQYGREVAIGVASGIHYLHSRQPQIVHRDIKSPNILLMDSLAKIADVGLARTKAHSDMTAQKGFTMAWAAPEVVYRRRATEKIDIWSFGVILWEIASGSVPHVGHLVMPKTAPYHVQRLFQHCTADEPTHRPAASDIVTQLRNAVK